MSERERHLGWTASGRVAPCRPSVCGKVNVMDRMKVRARLSLSLGWMVGWIVGYLAGWSVLIGWSGE